MFQNFLDSPRSYTELGDPGDTIKQNILVHFNQGFATLIVVQSYVRKGVKTYTLLTGAKSGGLGISNTKLELYFFHQKNYKGRKTYTLLTCPLKVGGIRQKVESYNKIYKIWVCSFNISMVKHYGRASKKNLLY